MKHRAQGAEKVTGQRGGRNGRFGGSMSALPVGAALLALGFWLSVYVRGEEPVSNTAREASEGKPQSAVTLFSRKSADVRRPVLPARVKGQRTAESLEPETWVNELVALEARSLDDLLPDLLDEFEAADSEWRRGVIASIGAAGEQVRNVPVDLLRIALRDPDQRVQLEAATLVFSERDSFGELIGGDVKEIDVPPEINPHDSMSSATETGTDTTEKEVLPFNQGEDQR